VLKEKKIFKYLLIPVFLIIPLIVNAQFYNGHQMKFGKNRVQFNSFYWKFYRFERYDVYSYEEGTDLSLFIAGYVDKEMERIERVFDYNFEKRLIFIAYNRMSDFRQSNIGQGIVDEDNSNIGGVTRIIQNKIFIYFEGDHLKLKKEITQTISEALIQEMLYGNDFKDNFTNSTLIQIPEWYLKGLVSYVGEAWNFDLENRVKDGILSGKYEKFNRLSGSDAVIAGHSFWKYIADTYGESVIPNILYLTRINKSTNSGFLYVLGLPIKELSYEWLGYYRDMYEPAEKYGDLPSEGKIFKKTKKLRVYNQVKMSPDGKNIAFVTNELGQFRMFLYNTETLKTRRILKKEHKIDQITDYSYPVIAWHPSGKILAFVTEEKGILRLNYYNLEEKTFSQRILLFYEKVLDLSYSGDGLRFVVSGVVNGQTDIYVHNIVSSTNEQITNDLADDFNPRFINNSNEIIFSSNRNYDSLDPESPEDPENNLADYYSVFTYNYSYGGGELKRISERNYFNYRSPAALSNNQFSYLSDVSGIVNRYEATYDSTISFIDTTTHYRFFSHSVPLTSYRRNIEEQDYIPSLKKYTELIFHDGRYNLYTGNIDPENSKKAEIHNTLFRDKYLQLAQEQDSLKSIKKKTILIRDVVDNNFISGEDTFRLDYTTIDINNYVFEKEKLNLYNERFRESGFNMVMYTVVETRKMYIDYETSFYPDYLVNKVDFSFLNESYQTFTGGAVYYNPGFNMLFKVGATDLFEDYRLIGGVRFATDFDSNEYLLSVENLKKRIDRQIIFHRQVFKTSTDYSYLKIFTHEIFYSWRYPLSQVAAFKGTVSARNDRIVYLSTDLQNLNEKDDFRPWLGVKGEYIFDNTRSLGINLYTGARFKLFAEGYKRINGAKSGLYVLGADFRHYLRIHRTLIWANRFATSTSFGGSPLIYYLGSVDNWLNLFGKVATFDQSVPIDYTKNYAYQTLATNMRGFTQNIRNGNNFALINSELRWPVIRYFANHPLSSNFWNNFQAVGFFDFGTAWSGLSPWSGKNAYDKETYKNGPVTVIVDSNREPLVAGYGFGFRSQLLGYFVRADWAWGIENRAVLPRIFYLSLTLDF
jgi:Tol biopolymer transport system component